MGEKITWAILAPLPPVQLASHASEIWHSLNGDLDISDYPWEIIAGTGIYSALVDREPGSEGLDEDIARQLSRELNGPVYLLRMREDFEIVWKLENGNITQELPYMPYKFAAKLGCTLPDKSAALPLKQSHSVCVVEGAGPHEVAQALGLNTPLSGPMHVEPTHRGTLVYSESGSVATFMYDLSEVFPGPVYSLVSGPEPGRFACFVVQHGEEIGEFERPELEKYVSPRLDSILGETEPTKIANLLGVPLELLGLRG